MKKFDGLNPDSFETIFGLVTIVYGKDDGYYYDIHSEEVVKRPHNLHLRRFDTHAEAFFFLEETDAKVRQEVEALLKNTNKEQ